MNYPTEILPQAAYKLIDCDLFNLTLARTYKLVQGQPLLQSNGRVSQKYICSPSEHISDYSTSLIGVFQIKHNQIELTADGKVIYNSECGPSDEIPIPDETHFSWDENKEHFFIDISDLSALKVAYNFAGESYLAKCIVVHSPMKWNYWHMSIRWRLSHDDTYLHQNKGKTWARNLCAAARASISQLVQFNKDGISEIEKKCYLN